jgi:hypothetical protein
VLKPDTALIAALTVLTVYEPVTEPSACTRISASVKPIWLKLPMPPETAEPY